jgi:hypothetical protein
MKEFDLTHERLLEVVGYDPDTGRFYRRVSRFRDAVGKPTGARDAGGYRRVYVDGYGYMAHRLAWFYVT